MNEEEIWRQLYPSYATFCRGDTEPEEYDPYEEADAQWRAEDRR